MNDNIWLPENLVKEARADVAMLNTTDTYVERDDMEKRMLSGITKYPRPELPRRWNLGRGEGLINVALTYTDALVFASAEADGARIPEGLLQWLTASENGISAKPTRLEELRNKMKFAFESPEWAKLMEAKHLALAFAQSLVDAEARSGSHSWLTGEFVMRETGLALIDELELREIRLSIQTRGILISLIDGAGGGADFAWWSPRWNNICISISLFKTNWALQAFCACIWHDSRVVANGAFRKRRVNVSSSGFRGLGDNNPIVLPRKVYEIDWHEPGMTKGSGGTRAPHWVRAHYRPLPEGHKVSDRAIKLAADEAHPPPPPGYTFVHSYGPDANADMKREKPRRIVAKGLQVAQLVLSKL